MEASRIFVRGVPPKLSEDDLRKHFSRYDVTDLKVFPHRRIAYIGYKTPEDAANAVKYFNKSFIRMSKIYVEIARPIADQSLPKSRRQLKEETTVATHTNYAPPPKNTNLKRKRDGDEEQQDPKLREFLEVMQPPSKAKAWESTEGDRAVDAAVESAPEVVVPNEESDNEYQIITKKSKVSDSIKPPPEHPQPVLKAEGQPDLEDSQLINEQPRDVQVARQEPVSDADWLRSRTSRVLDLAEDDGNIPQLAAQPVEFPVVRDRSETVDPGMDVEEKNTQTPNDDEHDQTLLTEEDRVRITGRLYLRNLPYDLKDDDLREHFSKYGHLEEVHVSLDKKTGKGKGFAFLQFEEPDHAAEAFIQDDGTVFQGRLLHILSAERKRDSKLDDFQISKLPLKKQREIGNKKKAGSAFNWNSLYLNADAAMSIVADRLGVDKAAMLDPTSSGAAVKQAQAETHIIQETKAYFNQHGVDLESFKRSSKGDTAILVKNIPHGASSDEVRKLMEEHGKIIRFLIPPAGLTAIIEFSNAAEAKSAFSSLAYRKFKDSILYLERAPKDLFREGAAAPATTSTLPTDQSGTKLSATDLLRDGPDSTGTATLFIRNLNFSTTTHLLSETFSPLNGYRSARVKTKVDPKRGVLSLGFGFVEFATPDDAAKALGAMDGYNLEGHRLEIKASHKGADAAEERRKEDAAKKAAGTKIIVKNLPFEATKKDIRALFEKFGQLRSVRLPKKFDSSSRGYAFAEFTTKRDAANTMEALRNTHLLGRRLVLDFAENETDDPEKELEKMQQKVGAQTNKVALQRLTGAGRKKFNITGNDDLDEA